MIDVEKLRIRMLTGNRSIAEFSRRASISKNIIYKIINRQKLPDSEEIKKIGKACEMSADEIKIIFLS